MNVTTEGSKAYRSALVNSSMSGNSKVHSVRKYQSTKCDDFGLTEKWVYQVDMFADRGHQSVRTAFYLLIRL